MKKVEDVASAEGRWLMISLLFVSRLVINPADREIYLNDILSVATAQNTMLGITGLLIVSPGHFAQLLEGPEEEVAATIARMKADPRHADLRVLRQGVVEKARWPLFKMARLDCQNFGSAVIDPVLKAALAGTDARAVQRLEQLMEAVGKDPAKTRT